MPNFRKLQKPEKDSAGRLVTNGKLVDQPARAGEHPENRVRSSNLGIANGVCGLHGVKHAGPCPAEIEVPGFAGKGEVIDEEDNA